MPDSVVSVACVVLSYFIGTFPSAALAGQTRGVDPTQTGSQNPGTTNILRTAGRRAAALTLLGDAGKGAIAAALGWAIGGHGLGVACGLAAIVGHVAPATRRFQGGKGVATALGMMAVLFPLLAVLAVVTFAVVVATTRRASLGSLAAAAVIPPVAGLTGATRAEVLGLVAGSLVIFVRHAHNIRRLISGNEPTLSAKRR